MGRANVSYMVCATLSMCILRQMAYYQEVATEAAQKLLAAETKPLIANLLCIKWGRFVYISR